MMRDITVKEVITRNVIGNVYVNKFLLSSTYNLQIHTRVRAKDLSYKYTWVRSGKTAVRKTDDSPVISINTFDDLAKLSRVGD